MLCNHFNIPVKCATSACSVSITSILLPPSPPLSLCCKTADLVSLAPWHAAYEQCNKMSAKTTSETFLRVDMRCGKAEERRREWGKGGETKEWNAQSERIAKVTYAARQIAWSAYMDCHFHSLSVCQSGSQWVRFAVRLSVAYSFSYLYCAYAMLAAYFYCGQLWIGVELSNACRVLYGWKLFGIPCKGSE